MTYRIKVSDEIALECDSPEGAAAFVAHLLDKSSGRTTSRPFSEAAVIRSLHQIPPMGDRIKTYRDRVFVYLKTQKTPMRKKQLITDCGVPSGSSTIVFRDERFKQMDDGRIWLSNVGFDLPLPDDHQVLSVQGKMIDEVRVRARQLLYSIGQPTGIRVLMKQLQQPESMRFIFNHEWFTNIQGKIWVSGEFYDDSDNGYAEDPADREYTEHELVECRMRIYDYLSSQTEPRRPALIAAALGVSHYLVIQALDHEWFERYKQQIPSMSQKKGRLLNNANDPHDHGVDGFRIARRKGVLNGKPG